MCIRRHEREMFRGIVAKLSLAFQPRDRDRGSGNPLPTCRGPKEEMHEDLVRGRGAVRHW